MQIMIDIPEGLKIDFESEQWTALSCMEMKNALMNGVLLPKHHGRLIDADELTESTLCKTFGLRSVDIENAPTIVEADRDKNDTSRANRSA